MKDIKSLRVKNKRLKLGYRNLWGKVCKVTSNTYIKGIAGDPLKESFSDGQIKRLSQKTEYDGLSIRLSVFLPQY